MNDLYQLGFIAKRPRVAVVQAEGASPFHRMIRDNLDGMIPEANPQTVASALNIGNPPSWKKARRTLEETNGTTVSVTDAEILDAKAIIDQSGIGCEPASASTVAGLRKLVMNQVIDSGETAACILTGNLLKDTDALRGYHIESMGSTPFANPVIQGNLTIEDIRRIQGRQ